MESIGGKVPLEYWRGEISADLIGDYDPKRQMFFLLLDAVERHASVEVEALGLCEHFAHACGDPVVALGMRLMLEDEERCQGLLKRISSRVRHALELNYSHDALPRTSGLATATAAADLTSLARALIDEEKLAARALRHLTQGEKEFISGLDSVLLEMLAVDCDRHIRLLHFIQRRLEARARAAKQQVPAT